MPKKHVRVTVKISWLLYDIMNETWLRRRTILDKDNYKQVASMYASADEENHEKVRRSIKRGFTEVRNELSEYLDESCASTDNSHYDGSADLVLNLIMPSNFNEAATAGIGEAAHAYMADIAIADWYMVTNKAEADQYYTLASKQMELLRRNASKRSRPKRPTK